MSVKYKIVVEQPDNSFLQHAFQPAISIAEATLEPTSIQFTDTDGKEYVLPVKYGDTSAELTRRWNEIRWS